MFCSKCGKKINKDDKFCTSCGSEIIVAKEKKVKDNVVVSEVETEITPTQEMILRKRKENYKTASIILGVISLLTCWTIILPIILGIIGLAMGFSARKNDNNFIAGIILNILGIVATIVFVIAAFVGLVLIGLNVEGKLTNDWCCSSNDFDNKCEIKFDLEDDYTYTMGDKYELFETPGSWDYEWLDDTNKGDKFKLTLDGNNYTAYVKKNKMTLYDSEYSADPVLYCTKHD